MIPKTLSAVQQRFVQQTIGQGIRPADRGRPIEPPRGETEPPAEVDETQASKDEPSGFIVLRLSRHADVPARGKKTSLREVAEKNEYRALLQMIDEFDLEAAPLIEKVDRQKILEMEARAAESPFPPMRSLTSYWRLDARHLGKELDEVVERLKGVRGAEHVYLQMSGSDPVVNPGDDDYNASQDYLDAAPVGIDARWAWTQTNGEGSGIGVIDMEQGWFLTHEDYAAKNPALLEGDNRDGAGTYKGNHGTAVLGVMIADDNDRGVVGIAPSAGPVNVTSHYIDGVGSGNVSSAVVTAVANLQPGDALLIEYQTSLLPAEIVDDNFDAIRLASALGVVVYEAAGNGTNDLDAYNHPTDGQILNRSSAGFRDSGAVMVGAGDSALPHDRASFSNFGSRVDCYGWGNNVVTCGYGTLDPGTGDDSTYASGFNGTSSATPIVAGAGLLVQGMVEGETGGRLSPSQMRDILSNPTTGTAQGPNVAGNIGVMPDVRAIIEADLGLVADVYMRDNVGDSGVVPSAGSLSGSPDIIVRKAAVADPNAAFGEGSGVENSATLGSSVEAGQDNFIYVRMKNRGGSDAADVTAHVFWSEVATLVTPDMWNPIGVTDPVDVPEGDTLVVTDPLTWDKDEIPAEGHYCFVGLLDHPNDPLPVVPSPTDWAGFQSFIRNQNNAAWRNFNVEDLDADPADPYIADFLIANALDEARVFDFMIDVRFPDEIEVDLEVPINIAKQVLGNANLDADIDRDSGMARIPLPKAPQLFIPDVQLPKGARLKSRFVVRGLKEHARPGNQFCIQQLYDGEAVGGITWKFGLSKRLES